MCGIVGLLVKNKTLRSQLGALMVPMLTGMTERGPDSAGLAVYTEPVSDEMHKLSLYSGEHAVDWPALLAGLRGEFSAHSAIAVNGNHAVIVREMRKLPAPIVRVAAVAVHEQQRRILMNG